MNKGGGGNRQTSQSITAAWRFPGWLARLIAGERAVMVATESRGASKAKAKLELGWTLRYPSWREGLAAVYGQPKPARA